MSETRLRIINEAEKVFARKGLLRTSIHEIAKACKLGVASLYHYYPNKEEILFAIMERNLKKLLEESNAHLSGITNPISKLEKYIWFQFYFAQKDPDNSKLVLLELRQRNELKGIPAYKYMRELVNQLVPILQEGQRQGLFEKDIDSLTFRNMVWGALEAFTRNWLIFNRPENILDYAPIVTRRILKGIATDAGRQNFPEDERKPKGRNSHKGKSVVLSKNKER